jgi:predicted flap endonuclease-1-like 5' DNA nuclease
MSYLLALGWPWFAAAFGVGALVGFISFTRARDAQFSGGWIVVVGVFALAAAFAASGVQLLAGRAALALDIAFLAGLAYAAGLPTGGFLKALGRSEAAPRRPRAELAPVTAAPARRTAPVPALAPPKTPAPTVRARKGAAGLRPETLDAPRNGVPDDLSRIKGLGPKSREKLNALGVFHYSQIAAWNLDNARWIGAAIGAPGRVERDKWIQQARALAGAGTDH